MLERDWERLGEVAQGSKATAVAASREGFGLLGTTSEPASGGLLERMKARRARLSRVDAGGMTTVWEGPGWVQALDCDGPRAVALVATLKPSGAGSDYHLLLSTDGGREWSARGAGGAPSLTQVRRVGEQELWGLGASYLGYSLDGGATWTERVLEGERTPHGERLRRVEGGAVLLGRGLTRDLRGTPQVELLGAGAARWVDVDEGGGFLAALVEGQARVGERQGAEVRWLEPLPAGREPLRLVADAGVLRLLTRSAAPAQGGGPLLHVSEDGGRSWSGRDPLAGAGAGTGLLDIAGREWGLGVGADGVLRGLMA